jgi:REP element-mobilizing transposase RayT
MTTARAAQIDYSATPYYHLMSRCVRRSYLCGIDHQTGRDYSHRKQWLVDRIKQLATIFSVHICAYAVMSNHYHLVLYVNLEMAKNWSDEEVLQRWVLLFGPSMVKNITKLPSDIAQKKLIELRSRLSNLSWFMRCLNEPIARRSNLEDEVDGRFWQGRFRSQALLDEGAVLSAMAYVDLNPIRAKVADTPENSDFTSIFERIKMLKITTTLEDNLDTAIQPENLMPFVSKTLHELPSIDFTLSDYLELLDTTGRILREDKPGRILEYHEPILSRLNLTPNGWLTIVNNLETQFCYVLGNSSKFNDFAKKHRIRAPMGRKLAAHCYR